MPVVTRIFGTDEFLIDFNESQFTITKNKVRFDPYLVDEQLLAGVPPEKRPYHVLLLADIALDLNFRLK